MSTQNELELDYGHIYIVELDKHKQIYKIGKTNETKIKDRIKQYPKNVKLIYSCDCPMVSKIEKKLIDEFTIKFKKYDKGREYFIGDIDEMLIEMNMIINDFIKLFNKVKDDTFFSKIKGEFDENNIMKIDMEAMYKSLDNPSLNAQEELHEFNILKEYKRLDGNKEKLNDYDKAIYNICEVLIDCVSHDKINGDYYSEKNNNKIKQAGNLLYSYDGISVMKDVLQLWVPKRYRREFDILWDGIGEWCA